MNLRNTKQRQAILDAIEAHGGHLTAEEVYKIVKRRHPRLSLGTVYRNLRVLAGQGAVRELDFGMAITHFETTKDSHYHLVCRLCGGIVDVEIELEKKLMALVEKAKTIGGFQIEEHRLDFVGVCERCQVKPSQTANQVRGLKAR
ncbi:MAG TPA: transcriptional repressor [Blastocatellia bacterium]|nr:transcriptional repressor [Blastocatellia bacterium]